MPPEADKAPTLSAESNFRLHGCKIDRSRLDHIVALAREGVPDDSYFTIVTERKAGGITSKISATTIDEVLQGVRGATLAGDPNILDNLSISISSHKPVEKRIYIWIRPDYVSVSVTGDDPGWVRGRIGGLRDLFKETRARYAIGKGNARFALPSIIIPIGSLLSSVLTGAYLRSHLAFALVIVVCSMLAAWSCGFALGSWIDRQTMVELHLVGESPKRKIDWINIGMLALTLIAVIVAIIAILVSHKDATRHNATGYFRCSNHSSLACIARNHSGVQYRAGS
jgi:hypothetical protein